jgi:hypothetical protein
MWTLHWLFLRPITKLIVPKVAYCSFSMGQISPFYGVKQLKKVILTIYITVLVTRGRHFGARESV